MSNDKKSANTNITTPRQWGVMVNRVLTAEKAVADNPWIEGDLGSQITHNEAAGRLRWARKALKEALIEAPWGQNGAMFKTHRGRHHGPEVRTLYLNGRIRAQTTYHRLEVFSAEEAEKEFNQRKAERRARQAQYMEERRCLIEDIVRYNHWELADLPGWRYEEGQNGGFFYREGATPYEGIAAWAALYACWLEDWCDVYWGKKEPPKN